MAVSGCLKKVILYSTEYDGKLSMNGDWLVICNETFVTGMQVGLCEIEALAAVTFKCDLLGCDVV
jgi:hypothetical protein